MALRTFVHFENKISFDTETQSGNIQDRNIAFIQDVKEISTHGVLYDTVEWSVLENPFIKPSDTVAGDVLVCDTSTVKKVFIPVSKLGLMNASRYVPIGVTVVPGVHDVYGDGSCGVMSLVPMNCVTPTQGGTESTTMVWGNSTDVSGIGNFNKVIIISGSSLSSANFGYLPKNGYWAGGESYKIPDPYNEDGSRNPDYYNKSVVSTNSLSDFKGKSNSAAALSARGLKDYSSWVPSATRQADYPAFSCCDMFTTPGTNQGDWFVPGMGELGYLLPRWNEILGAISSVNEVFGNVAVPVVDGDCYWSSSENASRNARYLHTSNGVGYSDKTMNYFVRAFLKVN